MTRAIAFVAVGAALACGALPALAAPLHVPSSMRPLAADGLRDLSAFSALPADPRPSAIVRGVHYWISNEDRLDVFSPSLLGLRGTGGVFVGVGAEQNWILAGWSRPDVLVLMDFDQGIVDLQHVYVVALSQAPTRQAFRALFVEDDGRFLREALERELPAGPVRAGALEALRLARPRIARRIGRLVSHLPARGVSSFLTDDDDYAFVRALVLSGRVFVVRGDLTGPRTMKAIGAASRAAGMEISTFYLSNAEQYFEYTARTRANLVGLPWGRRSMVLRTHGHDALSSVDITPPFAALEADLLFLPANKPVDRFHYGIQGGEDLSSLLTNPRVRTALDVLRRASPGVVLGTSFRGLKDDTVVVARSRERRAAAPSTDSGGRP